jgi:hypothetical protein
MASFCRGGRREAKRKQVPGRRIPPTSGCRPKRRPTDVPAHTCSVKYILFPAPCKRPTFTNHSCVDRQPIGSQATAYRLPRCPSGPTRDPNLARGANRPSASSRAAYAVGVWGSSAERNSGIGQGSKSVSPEPWAGSRSTVTVSIPSSHTPPLSRAPVSRWYAVKGTVRGRLSSPAYILADL